MTSYEPDNVWTIVVAAGTGQRFGGPKQFEVLEDKTIAEWAINTATAASDGVVVVLPAGSTLSAGSVHGGATRTESVRCGLVAVPPEATVICVHDAARPFASTLVFRAVIGAVQAGADGAVPGIAVVDTIKSVDSNGVVLSTPDRLALRAVQTPQAFRADILRRAYASAGDGSDDAAMVEKLGGKVVVVQGDESARKITTPQDLQWARQHAYSLTHGEI
ncbi:MAG: 2-C-methyl-D-erythritol 4-phosphate cytidylyltransferase [Ilumatobacteraceae bacterium]|nr:2-C-methyl-D-erythritol 4-phosphate cytidylyltransferase [Ilumatobacteraceae bacterium]